MQGKFKENKCDFKYGDALTLCSEIDQCKYYDLQIYTKTSHFIIVIKVTYFQGKSPLVRKQ